MPELKDRLIVALDVDNRDKARSLVKILSPKVKYFKVGSQLFTAYGPEAIRVVTKAGGRVFLDLKFHDIPNTVFAASAAATEHKVFMMTVHTKGGKEMLEAAVDGAKQKSMELKIPKPFLVGVTRLTSDKSNPNTQREVLEAARLAKDSGLDGVVCSALEAAEVRKECGKDFIIVTPGIRPKDYPGGDQKRKATAAEAIAAGADFIVVGRPILEAASPLAAAEKILGEINYGAGH